MTDDLALERELRSMLGERDPGSAPGRLSSTIHERLRFDGHRSTGWWRARLANVGSIAAVAILAIVVVLAIGRPQTTGPAASPTPTVGPYVLTAGDGIVSSDRVPLFQALSFVVVMGGLIVVTIRTRRKWTGILAALGALIAMLLALNIGTSNAVEFSGGGYGVTPYRESHGEPGMYVAVTGDEPFTLLVTVTNTSKLPLELRGLAAPAEVRAGSQEPLPILPRFVGLALLADEDMTFDAIVPFRPVTLQPGSHVNVAVLGMAGTCAIPNVGPEGQAGYQLETINLVYEQLTIIHEAAFGLPEPVVITTTGSCS